MQWMGAHKIGRAFLAAHLTFPVSLGGQLMHVGKSLPATSLQFILRQTIYNWGDDKDPSFLIAIDSLIFHKFVQSPFKTVYMEATDSKFQLCTVGEKYFVNCPRISMHLISMNYLKL